MTLDERIKFFEQEANDMEQVADTGVCTNGTEISFLYADDTECINRHIERLRNNAREYRQIAEWLKELKRYKELQEATLMREATPEELESVNSYIRSISKPTGVNIWDEIEKADKAIKYDEADTRKDRLPARDLLAMIEVKEPNELIVNSWWGSFVKDYKEALQIAIKALEFAEWVAREMFDDTWEYNKDSFEELVYRKLAKLGIVKAEGDEWILVESQEDKEQGMMEGNRFT